MIEQRARRIFSPTPLFDRTRRPRCRPLSNARSQQVLAYDLDPGTIAPKFLGAPESWAQIHMAAKWLLVADDEHRRRRTDGGHYAGAGSSQPVRERTVARSAQDGHALTPERAAGRWSRRASSARAGRSQPAREVDTRVIDGTRDHHAGRTGIAQRVVMLVSDAQETGQRVQAMAVKMWPGTFRHPYISTAAAIARSARDGRFRAHDSQCDPLTMRALGRHHRLLS